MLAVELLQLLVNRWVFQIDYLWRLEKHFGQYRKKFGRVGGGVGVDDRVLARIDARAQVINLEYPAIYQQLQQFYRQHPLGKV